MNGVMTYLLTKIIREHSGITYGSLLEKLHEDIGKIQQSKHFNGFFKRIFYSRIDQVGLYHILYMLLLLRSIYIYIYIYTHNIICILYPIMHHLWYRKGNELHMWCLFEEASIPSFCVSLLNISWFYNQPFQHLVY
jgi:hypothetical protein